MKTKEIKINCPEGYTIDEENSTFECIKFKPIEKPKFSDYDSSFKINGFYIDETFSTIEPICDDAYNNGDTKNVFATEKQAKSALAMAQISQIMANDERFGGAITEKEWENQNIQKYCIVRTLVKLVSTYYSHVYFTDFQFLAFHTEVQRDLFLQENLQLVKDYLMID